MHHSEQLCETTGDESVDAGSNLSTLVVKETFTDHLRVTQSTNAALPGYLVFTTCVSNIVYGRRHAGAKFP